MSEGKSAPAPRVGAALSVGLARADAYFSCHGGRRSARAARYKL